MDINDLRIKFASKWLACLKPFKATGDIRYYLNGICVEKAPQGGVYLISSDGCTMCAIYDKDGECNSDEPVTLAAPPELFTKGRQAKVLATGKKGSGIQPQVIVTGKRLSIAKDYGQECSDLESYVQAGNCRIEGKFPDWRRVLPRWDALKPGCMRDGKNGLNPNLLARTAEVAKLGDRYCGIALWQADENSAVLVQFPRTPEAIVVIMPMRDLFIDIEKQYADLGLGALKASAGVSA